MPIKKIFRWCMTGAIMGIAIVMAFVSTYTYANTRPLLKIEFTEEEQSYIKKTGSIKMCIDPDWVPFERINEQGQHEGISADLIQIVAQQVGLKIELYPVKTWEESLAASKGKLCQIMSFLNQTPARDKWLIFTDPIFTDPNIIITREEQEFIDNLKELKNKSVALPKGTMVEERIHREYPNLSIILTNSEPEAITLVSERKADMTIRSLIVAAYAIKKEGLFNLKISGKVPEYTNQLRIGVLKDEKILRDILNKGVKTISQKDRDAISNHHVPINFQDRADHSLLFKWLIGSVIVLLTAFYWNRRLYKINKKLERLSTTDKLTGLFNRVKTDSVFENQIQQSQNLGKIFSIILLDIDYFKKVNDNYGHQVGDLILCEVASILKSNIRKIDIAGRWGGEEFLIICPETSLDEAINFSENLRQILEGYPFPVTKSQTASFGVSTYQKGDCIKDIIARADAALYNAKNNGRNRIEAK